MACGKAVAAYSAGSVQEIVGDTGLIVQTDDSDGLADAVERLAGDIELRQRLGNRAQAEGRNLVQPGQEPRTA